jgi:hypothetical protein
VTTQSVDDLAAKALEKEKAKELAKAKALRDAAKAASKAAPDAHAAQAGSLEAVKAPTDGSPQLPK